MFRALSRMLLAITNKEDLSVELKLEFNWLIIVRLWSKDYYLAAKEKGKLVKEFKKSQNVISVKKIWVEVKQILSLSNPENVVQYMNILTETVTKSDKKNIEKVKYLAQ